MTRNQKDIHRIMGNAHYLVTGGAGFIGSWFIRTLLKQETTAHVTNLDLLTYAGHLENLRDVESDPANQGRYRFVHGDITDARLVQSLMGEVDICVNIAAQTHVDRSISGPTVFIETNVLGTQTLLEAVRLAKIQRFLQVSTDEVYGSLGPSGLFTEETPLDPSSPYSASKTAADLIALSYFKTYDLPVLVTRCSNNYGPYQFPEKLIPLFILNALQNKPVPVYGDGLNVRDWIHVQDHSEAVLTVLQKGQPGQVYNIGSINERSNLEITHKILAYLNKPQSLIQFVEDRLGHDRRYAIDNTKIQSELGWVPKKSFDTALNETIQWYLDNPGWVESVLKKRQALEVAGV